MDRVLIEANEIDIILECPISSDNDYFPILDEEGDEAMKRGKGDI